MTGASQNRQAVLRDTSDRAVLYRLSELAAEFGAQRIASDSRSVADRVEEGRFYVACIGQFKRGKSTLLNALIGHPVLPSAVVPVTSVPTVIRRGDRLAARVRFHNATWTNISVSDVEEYVSERKNPENAKGVDGVEIFAPSPLLETGMCLVDTPGLGSVFAGNSAATRAFIPHIDAAIVVIGADPPLSGDELQLVETLSQEVHDFLFVLNKADRTNAAERSAALEFARHVLETRLKRTLPAIFEISALDRLERTGPERDWEQFVHSLEELVARSGRSLARKAADRGIQNASRQLLAVITEERNALERPVEESERRHATLQKTLEESETTMRELGILLSAEQQRLSGVFVERMNAFLRKARVNAQNEMTERLSSLKRTHNGPKYRRNVNQLAQEIAREQLKPWLGGEAKFAEEEFRKTAKRFVVLANEYLHRCGETDMPELNGLPGDLDSEQGLSIRSQFHFHLIERVATPASPFLFISDLLLGTAGLYGGIVRDARQFLDQLLEVNSSRVQSDVTERVRESRKKLDAEINAFLREASAVAGGALARGRAAQAAGIAGVQAARDRLDSVELEVQSFLALGPASVRFTASEFRK
jgi:GTPase SAR1 family protein